MQPIPIYQPTLGGREKEYVNECLETNWISSKGRFASEFESAFARWTGVRHAAAVCNGTVALHLALVSLGIGPGDEVIVPTLTYIAPVNAILYTGATPVFVDSHEETWQMDPRDVERKITKQTRAILAVHLYGQPCDLIELVAIAGHHRIFLIEDCAEAIGSKVGDRHVGTFGEISTFSFFGNKTITTGEGGMVVTNDDTLHDHNLHFKGQGLAKHREYWHDVVGYNYRMTNLCAALGLAQLEQADSFLARKREIASAYSAGLDGLPLSTHREARGTTHSFWMCSILTDDPADRDPLRGSLAGAGVETRPVFYPVHTMPMHAARFERHPVAESLGWRGINLPSWPGLSDAQVDEVCQIIRRHFKS